MSNNYVKTIDNSSVLDTTITIAIQPLATTASVSNAITASSILPLSNTFTNTNTFSNNINLLSSSKLSVPHTYGLALGNFVSNETIFFIDPLNNIVSIGDTVIGTTYRIITLLVGGILTKLSELFAGSQGFYLGPYSITNNFNYGFVIFQSRYVIWNYPFVMGSSTLTVYAYSMNGSIPFNPTVQYAAVTIHPKADITPSNLSYLSNSTSNIQTQINSLNTSIPNNLLLANNNWSGTNIYKGVSNYIQTADTLLNMAFTSNPSINMLSGMVYNLQTNSTPINSLSFINIPTTPLQTYVFNFIIQPSTSSSPWYLKPPINSISITAVGSATLTFPVYGISNVVLPTSYTFILQTITIVNVSGSSTPNFVCFLSASGY